MARDEFGSGLGLTPNLYKKVVGDELNLQRPKKMIKTTPE